MHATPFLPRSVRPAWLRGIAFGCLLVGAPAHKVEAQEAPGTLPVAADSSGATLPDVASPRGAFLRSVLLPGWGHASIGAYRRGAFYFVVESATAWALTKAIERSHEAGARIRFRKKQLRAQLAADGVVNPDTIQARLDEDETLQDLDALESARRQQREDWTTLSIFLLFLSGADAYVSAHLQHFPVPIEIEATPSGSGRMDLSIGLKLPR